MHPLKIIAIEIRELMRGPKWSSTEPKISGPKKLSDVATTNIVCNTQDEYITQI